MNNQKNDTGYRVFKTFILIAQKSISINDILKDFIINFHITTKETIYKYLNTITYANFEIIKNKNKYTLKSFPPIINLDEQELQGLNLINSFANAESENQNELQKFLYKIFQHISEYNINILKKSKINIKNDKQEYKEMINIIERYINDKALIKIELKNKETYNGYPIDLKREQGQILLKFYNLNKAYDINIKKINKITFLNKYNNNNFNQISIQYKLKNKLAKTYRLRVGEKIIATNNDNSIIISNSKEAENTLLKRLIRYETNCEVLAPIDTRINMKNLINNTYKLYEED